MIPRTTIIRNSTGQRITREIERQGLLYGIRCGRCGLDLEQGDDGRWRDADWRYESRCYPEDCPDCEVSVGEDCWDMRTRARGEEGRRIRTMHPARTRQLPARHDPRLASGDPV